MTICFGTNRASPDTCHSVDVQHTFEDHGVEAARLQLVAGDVRDAVPELADAPDTIVMKHFLSAFSDGDVSCILANCKRMLAPSGTILLLQVSAVHMHCCVSTRAANT